MPNQIAQYTGLRQLIVATAAATVTAADGAQQALRKPVAHHRQSARQTSRSRPPPAVPRRRARFAAFARQQQPQADRRQPAWPRRHRLPVSCQQVGQRLFVAAPASSREVRHERLPSHGSLAWTASARGPSSGRRRSAAFPCRRSFLRGCGRSGRKSWSARWRRPGRPLRTCRKRCSAARRS